MFWRKSYSQYGEDTYIRKLIRKSKSRYVVDVGANDGQSWSNSYGFVRDGYSALLIEPMPLYANYCRQLHFGNPKVVVEEVAILCKPEKVTFYLSEDKERDLLAMGSSVRKEIVPNGKMSAITVEAIPLSTLLEKHNVPKDYALLSVDAEGVDLEVLQSAALDIFRPNVICVEHGSGSEGIRPFLESKGYNLKTFLGANGIYTI